MWAKRVFLVLLVLVVSGCDSDHGHEHGKIVDLGDRVAEKEVRNKGLRHKHGAGSEHTHAKDHMVYRFGFDLRSSPQEDARQYLPFLKYLEKTTGYRFELRFTPRTSSIVDDLGSNKVQFAAVGATSYLKANKQYGVRILVRGVNNIGKAEYRSMFVVRPGSKIRSVADLKGKRLAFGSKTSTQGHLIPRIVLNDSGVRLKDLAGYSYTGSHQSCVSSVVAGKHDACAMQDTMAMSMQKQGLVKIIYKSRYYPSSGIAASKQVPDHVVDKVREALIAFKPNGADRAGLYNWGQTEMPNGFVAAKHEQYIELLQWAQRLGFF